MEMKNVTASDLIRTHWDLINEIKQKNSIDHNAISNHSESILNILGHQTAFAKSLSTRTPENVRDFVEIKKQGEQ